MVEKTRAARTFANISFFVQCFFISHWDWVIHKESWFLQKLDPSVRRVLFCFSTFKLDDLNSTKSYSKLTINVKTSTYSAVSRQT